MYERQDEALNYIDDSKPVLIAALVERDGDGCFYCDAAFDEDSNDRHGRTIDHYHSVDYGRKNGWSFLEIHGIQNLKLAGKACNSKKSNRAWLPDGTLEPRGSQKAPSVPRMDVCDTCMSGRLLYPGEVCHICGIDARPAIAPAMLQKSPKDCDHANFHCYMCFIGHIPRKRAMEDVFGVKPGTEQK